MTFGRNELLLYEILIPNVLGMDTTKEEFLKKMTPAETIAQQDYVALNTLQMHFGKLCQCRKNGKL